MYGHRRAYRAMQGMWETKEASRSLRLRGQDRVLKSGIRVQGTGIIRVAWGPCHEFAASYSVVVSLGLHISMVS